MVNQQTLCAASEPQLDIADGEVALAAATHHIVVDDVPAQFFGEDEDFNGGVLPAGYSHLFHGLLAIFHK